MEIIDFGEPFYVDKQTAPPPTNTKIKNYFVYSSILPEPTNYSYIYICDDHEKCKKVIKFIKFRKKDVQKIKNEIEIMKIIQHPNIIKCESHFRYGPYMCMILPYTTRRTLLTLIIQKYNSGMPDDVAAKLLFQMLRAVDFLHNADICHRDIKPDNFLLFDPIYDQGNDDIPSIVLTDFGFATLCTPGTKLNDRIGTPQYMAPEILKKNSFYDKSIDIWALGITLYIMLAGIPALQKLKYDIESHHVKISENDLDVSLLNQLSRSFDVINIVQQMCKHNPAERITARNALKNPWILRNISNYFKTQTEESIAKIIGISSEYDFNPKM